MKQACILSTLLLTLTVTVTATLPRPASATSSSQNTQVTQTIPTKAPLTAKISEVKAIEGYAEYSTLDPELLPYITDYAENYLYLFALVNTAESMLANYEQTSPADLDMIMAAADDAIIAHNLKFGTIKKTTTEQDKPTTAPVQTPQVNSTTTQSTSSVTQNIPTPPTSTTPQSTQQSSNAESSNQTVAENSQPQEVATLPIEVPATSTPAPSEQKSNRGTLDSHPLAFIIISAAGLGIILALIISSRQKSYRPGRKV